MSELSTSPRLRLGVGITCAILAAQIAGLLLWGPVRPLRTSPEISARGVYATSLVLIPSLSVAVAVLIARWVERKLVSVSRRACIVMLVVTSVAVVCTHLRVRREFVPFGTGRTADQDPDRTR